MFPDSTTLRSNYDFLNRTDSPTKMMMVVRCADSLTQRDEPRRPSELASDDGGVNVDYEPCKSKTSQMWTHEDVKKND